MQLYAIVDIETTGGHAAANGITEIAVFIHDGKKVTDQFHSLINPGQKIPLYITSLTGISNAMVASAPSFEEVAAELVDILQDKVFIAHNVNFDYSFIRHQLQACGYDLSLKKLCTVRLGKKVFPGLPSYSLGNLCKSLQIPVTDRHRAGGDAKATVLLFEKLLMNGAQEHIDAMLKRTSSEQWLPLHLHKSEIQRLPSLPGVYYFHNAKGKVIYVGKAVNIKKRVISHFTHHDPSKKRQHFLRYVQKITHAVCANELHALVLESTEIKRLWPPYNKSQKQPAQRFGLYCFEDSGGYLRLAIDKRKKHFPAVYYFNLLHEGQVLLRNMTEEFSLDPGLCFMDKNQPVRSKRETAESHNSKVKVALERLEKQLPTFAIIDKGLSEDEKLCLLVEKGSFWGMGYLGAKDKIIDVQKLKEKLQPYSDNDFIRNSIYAYAEANPGRKIILENETGMSF